MKGFIPFAGSVFLKSDSSINLVSSAIEWSREIICKGAIDINTTTLATQNRVDAGRA